jgi:hypothetical protein
MLGGFSGHASSLMFDAAGSSDELVTLTLPWYIRDLFPMSYCTLFSVTDEFNGRWKNNTLPTLSACLLCRDG